MKWLIYFCCYYSGIQAQEEIRMAGTMEMTDTTITAYIWPHDYTIFTIDSRSWWQVDGKEVTYATLYLTHPNGSGVMMITPKDIILYYRFERGNVSYRDNVEMERKIVDKPTGKLLTCRCDENFKRNP